MFVNDAQPALLQVTLVERDQCLLGHPMSVAEEGQYGAAARRPWVVDEEAEVRVLWRDVLCQVQVDGVGCLDHPSLERLRRLGLEVVGGPLTH